MRRPFCASFLKHQLTLSLTGDAKTIYGCHLELGDYLVNRNGGAFDREEYRKRPEQFDSLFHSKVRRAFSRVPRNSR